MKRIFAIIILTLLYAIPSYATVGFDACTESAEFRTTSPFTFNHTPSGTPKGVWLFIAQDTLDSTDTITGTVSYGGVAMARPTNGTAADTVGEPGRSYQYFLGANIPTGTQTISIAHTGADIEKIATVCTVTASTAATEVKVSGVDQESQADPSVTLDCGADTCIRFTGILSGHTASTSLTPNASMTAVSAHDTMASAVARVDRETSPSSGSTAMSYTSTIDDVAMVAAAIGEVPDATSFGPLRRRGQ